MSNQKYFVVGDVHGEFERLKEILKHWKKDQERLVFVGDLADRGPKSKDSFLLAKALVEEYQGIYVLGNHEELFLRWLEHPNDMFDLYRRNGGEATINSLLDANLTSLVEVEAAADYIKTHYGDLIEFLKERPRYVETEDYIFVHAGVNLDLDDWRKSDPDEFIWIREAFHDAKNTSGKAIVFGHTPIQYLPDNKGANHIWVSDQKIGIDGGAVFGGVLHGVVLSDKGIEVDYQA